MPRPAIRLVSTIALLCLITSAAQAADPAAKCRSGKLKEAAKYASCRLKAEAKAVQTATTPNYTQCEAKFTPKFNGLETKAGPGICPSEGDEPTINARVTNDADDIATLLAGGSLPTCGDALAEGAESCDGADLGGEDCVSLGFASGEPRLHGGCGWDVSACVGNPPSNTCGDGVMDAGEECEWGDLGGESCTSLGYVYAGVLDCVIGACVFDESGCASKLVFVTSTGYDGNLGGIAGADAKCAAAASAAGRSGTFKAWIGTAGVAPATSFVQSAVPYVLPNGQKIADDWADLTDGFIDAPINVTEFGVGTFSTQVWTAVAPGGTSNLVDCLGWSSNASGALGGYGLDINTNSSWTQTGALSCTCRAFSTASSSRPRSPVRAVVRGFSIEAFVASPSMCLGLNFKR